MSFYWRENARARAHTDLDLIREAHRFVLDHFGGCKHRAAEFFKELADPTVQEQDA